MLVAHMVLAKGGNFRKQGQVVVVSRVAVALATRDSRLHLPVLIVNRDFPELSQVVGNAFREHHF